jgi:hypothetical protein
MILAETSSIAMLTASTPTYLTDVDEPRVAIRNDAEKVTP